MAIRTSENLMWDDGKDAARIAFLEKENDELWAKNEKLMDALLTISKQAREAVFPYLKDKLE